MRLTAVALLLTCSVLGACSASDSGAAANDPAVLTSNDFEHSVGWGAAEATSLSTAKAHSGRWSIRVSPEVPFSYTFARPLGELDAPIPQKMVLEAWALRVAGGSTAQVVVQVDASTTDEHRVLYAALPLATAVPKFGEWTAVRLPLTLPANAIGTNNLKVYLWNDHATTPTYLDDVVLRKADK